MQCAKGQWGVEVKNRLINQGRKRKGKQRMSGAGEGKGTLFFLQLHRAKQERIKSGTI